MHQRSLAAKAANAADAGTFLRNLPTVGSAGTGKHRRYARGCLPVSLHQKRKKKNSRISKIRSKFAKNQFNSLTGVRVLKRLEDVHRNYRLQKAVR